MLKRKLTRNVQTEAEAAKCQKTEEKQESQIANKIHSPIKTSSYFTTPFWKRFFDLECKLNEDLKTLTPPSTIKYIYNPLEYAATIHCEYLRRFLQGPKRVMLVGMNPGPNGMAQTGVPFGNVATVRDLMHLSGNVEQPPAVHAKRPVNGLNCSIEEPSGKRIWTLLKRLANDSLDIFSQLCFVHNFCPLVFYDSNGRNLTPSDLKGDEYKSQLRNLCLQTLELEIDMCQPEIVIAVGEYVHSALKKSVCAKKLKILRLPHPSPRSLNNTNWPEKAEIFFRDHDLLKYIKNDL